MTAGSPRPLRGRDVLLAAAVAGVVVALAVASDPAARSTFLSQPGVREVLCSDDLAVTLFTGNPGDRLTAPEGGVAVRAHRGEENVSARLELHRRDGDAPWRVAWELDAPSGREIFYVANVAAGTEVYVLAKPSDASLCPARSAVLAAST